MTVEIRIGDCRALLQAMPDESVQCIVTSPPYWGLRDYGVAGQIGLEPTWKEHLVVMLDVFREARRVLKSDGIIWLNYGDGYSSIPNGRSAANTKAVGNDDRTFRDKPVDNTADFAPKQRMMMPARLAIALQDDGWWIRDEIVWAKANPMPSSVDDRTCPSHEMLYMLTKSPRYYYDSKAIEEPIAASSAARYAQATIDTQTGGAKQDKYEAGFTGQRARSRRPNEIIKSLAAKARNNQDEKLVAGEKWKTRHDGWKEIEAEKVTRKKRSVWNIPIEPMAEAHFATFPTGLVEPCIKAGSRAGDLVMDFFGGAGTVGLVADRLQRNAIMFELNPEYADIAERRLRSDGGMFIDVTVSGKPTVAA